jgi:hypothetical protein
MDGIMNVATTRRGRHGSHSDIMLHNRGMPQLRVRKGFQETEGIASELRAQLEEEILGDC